MELVPKQRPIVPPKPNLNALRQNKINQTILPERKLSQSSPEGKVKKIVLQFSGQEGELVPWPPQEICHAVGDATATLISTPQRGLRSASQPKPATNDEQERDHHQDTSTSTHMRGNRSAPDGSEGRMPDCVAVKKEKHSTAHSTEHHKTQCHCMCHLKRPGMRLVWVPSQQDNDDCVEIEAHYKSRGAGSQGRNGAECSEKAKRVPHKQRGNLSTRPTRDNKLIDEAVTEREMFTANVQQSHQAQHSLHTLQSEQTPSLLTPNSTAKLYVNRAPPACSTNVKPKTVHVTRPLPSLPFSHLLERDQALPLAQNRPTAYSEINGKSSLQKSSREADGWDEYDEVKMGVSLGEDCVDMGGDAEEMLAESPRRISSDWGPSREDEPLYQINQAKAIKEAIRVQTAGSNANRATGDHHVRHVLGPLRQSASRRGPTEVMLWQHLPVVRESGLLENLSHQELQRQESMFELLTSEDSYLRSLRVLIDHFLMSRELGETILIHDKRALFSNILQVSEVSERFFKDLLERVDESIKITDVCDIIHRHALHNFSIYINYIRNQGYQEKAYTSLMHTNRLFALVMKRLEDSPLCCRLSFSSFLLLPFQRITRIKIIIQNILRRTPEGCVEEHTASMALAAVSEVIKESNKQVGQMKQMEELIQITNTLEFEKLKAIPIVSKTRFLEKQGEVHELSKGGSLFSGRFKLSPIYLFLFNDLLLITCRKGAARYIVTDYAHRSLVQVQPLEGREPGSKFEHVFSILLLENHKALSCEHLLKASSESDKYRWVAALPALNSLRRESEELIYQDWDCPQVQCLEPYPAKQADELTLESADIINVLRKTPEGWYEGIRLSDMEKGWFPADNVMEITNEHVRRRNLCEQYRIAQAAAKVI